MSDQHTIDHLGFVDSVSENSAVIHINSQSACAACHAKGACTAADQEDKTLTVPTGGLTVIPGEQVKVIISKRTGLRAVAIGYMYPFLIIMVVLIVLTLAGIPELQAGLWSLAALGPYYLGIYFLKERIGKSFTFKLQKL